MMLFRKPPFDERQNLLVDIEAGGIDERNAELADQQPVHGGAVDHAHLNQDLAKRKLAVMLLQADRLVELLLADNLFAQQNLPELVFRVVLVPVLEDLLEEFAGDNLVRRQVIADALAAQVLLQIQAYLNKVHGIVLRGKHFAQGRTDGIVDIGVCGNEVALYLFAPRGQIKVKAGHLDQEPACFAGELLAVLERYLHGLGARWRGDAGFLHLLEFPREEPHMAQQLQLLDPGNFHRLDRSRSGGREIERPVLRQKADEPSRPLATIAADEHACAR